ncbi:MAG TPA: hypothetical protein VKV26_11510 [Dehalococcoidia bacterium]|nr:hypothetical protein [Dehalococcoidia bacterium]
MRRWLVIVAAVALIGAALPLIAADSPAAQGAGPNATPQAGRGNGNNASPPTNGDDENFRKDLKTYFAGMQDVLNALQQNPNTSHHLGKNTVHDPGSAIKVAQQHVDTLNANELRELEKRYGTNPAWRDQPAKLKALIDSVGPGNGARPGGGRRSSALPGNAGGGGNTLASAIPDYSMPASLTALFGSLSGTPLRADALAVEDALAVTPAAGFPEPYLAPDCNSPGNAKTLFYAYWAAADAAAIANAVASGAPDGADFAAVTIIAGAAFGVANGIAIELQKELTFATDCITFAFNQQLVSTFPQDPNNPGSFIPASSQISVNALAALSGQIQTILNNVQTDVNLITQDLASLIIKLGTAQGTATQIHNTATTLQGQTDTLQSTVGQPNDNTDNTSNGLANDINGHMDTLLGNISAFQALSIQMEIERNMAVSSQPSLAIFALPAAKGGYLETARAIVAGTIANLQAAGQGVGNAQQFLAQGNAAAAGGQFETAYEDYAMAYQTAVQ